MTQTAAHQSIRLAGSTAFKSARASLTYCSRWHPGSTSTTVFAILVLVISRLLNRGIAVTGLLLALNFAACHREEQAVVGVAQTAVKAEQIAQANATERDTQRAQLEQIPLPTKSMYVDVREPSEWANPFISVGVDSISIRVTLADANPSPVGEGSMLRPAAARRQ